MDELLKSIKYFVTRDVIYILGGSTVIVSFLYLFKYPLLTQLPIPIYLLIAGLGYAIGYALQDFACLLPGITTKADPKINKFIKKLYERFTRTLWHNIESETDLEQYFYRINIDRMTAEHDRIITLMQVGTTLGPSGIVSGLLIVCRWFSSNDHFDFWLAIGAFIISTMLLILSRIKVAQYAQFLYSLQKGVAPISNSNFRAP